MSPTRGRGRPSLEIDEEAALRDALAAFAEHGPQTTSMEQISARCGIAKTTLHDRFGGKSELFNRAMELEHDYLARHLLATYEASRDLDMLEQLREGFRAFFDYARRRPDAFRLMFGDAASSSLWSESAKRGRRLVLEAVTRLVETRSAEFGRTTGISSAMTADMLVGTGEYVARRLADHPEIDLDAAATFTVELMARGVFGVDPEIAAALDA